MDGIRTEFQPLQGLCTIEDTAKALGCTPARVRQMIHEGNKFKQVKTFGDRGYLIPQGEVTRLSKVLERQRARRNGAAS